MKENQQEPKQEQPKEPQGNLGVSFPSVAHGNKPVLQKKAISTGKGSADLHDHGSAAKLYNLEVGVGKRGAGGGKELVAKASQEAMAMGKKKLVLDSQDNGSGKLDNWYKNQGFKSTGKNNGMNSFEMPLQRKEAPQNISKVEKPPLQAKTENKTGLPNKLKSKMEGTFGHSLNNIRINTNSALPAKVGAIATTQGNRIDFAPGHYNPHTSQGQKLIGHEAWHTVQQAQGRVKPTLQMKTGYLVNDSAALEKEADVMGQRVAENHLKSGPFETSVNFSNWSSNTIQKSALLENKATKSSQGTFLTVTFADHDGANTRTVQSGNGKHAEDIFLDTLLKENEAYLSSRTDNNIYIGINRSPCFACTKKLIALVKNGYKRSNGKVCPIVLNIQFRNLYETEGVEVASRSIKEMQSTGRIKLSQQRTATTSAFRGTKAASEMSEHDF